MLFRIPLLGLVIGVCAACSEDGPTGPDDPLGSCPTVKTLSVTVETVGEDMDPDGYRVSAITPLISGSWYLSWDCTWTDPSGRSLTRAEAYIGVNGGVNLSLRGPPWRVRLTGVAENCDVEDTVRRLDSPPGEWERLVTTDDMVSPTLGRTQFRVHCSPVP